jgi:Outer membrane receptor proteins, mostly Fe transport
VRRVFGLPEWIFMLLLLIPVTVLLAQENQKEQEKKNPESQNLDIGAPQQDTSNSVPKVVQRQLPKFDLPEYVITGVASVDLPKAEKISFEDVEDVIHTKRKSLGNIQRECETMELEVKRLDNSQAKVNTYSGMVQAGIGSYFTPQAGFWFGQSLPNYQYTFGGTYHLTNGFAQHTDQSDGSFTAAGRTYLASNEPMIQNAALDGGFGYKSESFRFYGSTTPNLQRTISDFQLKAGIENQAMNNLPYSVGISLDNINVSDSSASANETRFDLNLQTALPIASLPLHMKFHGMTASGGLGFMDVSGGIQNYWYAGLLFEGSLHVYWAQGMAGQSLFRLRPHLMVSYPITSQHRVYVSYMPMVLPMTLASNIRVNRFLYAASPIRHTDVSNAGEIGVESDWNEIVRSRVTFGVKSINDLTMFSDSSRQGVWTLAYNEHVTIITFCAEMVAKFESNDYFASTIMLRSIKDSFLGKHIPYFPTIEVGCRASHRFGTAIVVNADARFVGEQQADLIGGSAVSSYAVIDVSGDYTPLDFLRLSIGIKNLTDARYEMWRGYREFPLTMYVAVQVKW